jgi:hypothetical protein
MLAEKFIKHLARRAAIQADNIELAAISPRYRIVLKENL